LAEIVTVLAPTATMVEPKRIPGPEMGSPTVRPVTLDTPVMTGLPKVVVAVKMVEVPAPTGGGTIKLTETPLPDAVAPDEIVMVVDPTDTIVALLGMPGPVMISPGVRPGVTVSDIPVSVVLPLLVVAVKGVA
jgi:hypothetical protein